MRVGVYGGSFDPPHVGHLLVASDAVEALRLDRLLFVPAATQPLKAAQPRTPAADRLAMVRLLAGDDRRFAVETIEIDRGGVSFTVDTLAALAARDPRDERFLLVGADVLASFGEWRDPARVRAMATLVVLPRGGVGVEASGAPGGSAMLTSAGGAGVAEPRETHPVVLPIRRIDVSSTEIRARVREGRPIRGFVPDAIAEYIHSRGLYR